MAATKKTFPGIYHIVSGEIGANDLPMVYIGQAHDVLKRLREHKSNLTCGRCEHPKLQAAWTRIQWTLWNEPLVPWTFTPVIECELSELNRMEQFYIDLNYPNLYNTQLGVNSGAAHLRGRSMTPTGLAAHHAAHCKPIVLADGRSWSSIIEFGKACGIRIDLSTLLAHGDTIETIAQYCGLYGKETAIRVRKERMTSRPQCGANRQAITLPNGKTFLSNLEFSMACGYANTASMFKMLARGYTYESLAKRRGIL